MNVNETIKIKSLVSPGPKKILSWQWHRVGNTSLNVNYCHLF